VPGALLSESYRNAVAAAIFLAAATKHSGVPRFTVLDDVTSSFDAGDQFALMDAVRTLLRYSAVPDGLQFIFLSHDTSLEKYFNKLNGTADWHHQKLQGMPPKGRLMVSAQEADRLKAQALQHLNAGQIDIELRQPYAAIFSDHAGRRGPRPRRRDTARGRGLHQVVHGLNKLRKLQAGLCGNRAIMIDKRLRFDDEAQAFRHNLVAEFCALACGCVLGPRQRNTSSGHRDAG
jgi:hypothetical protein